LNCFHQLITIELSRHDVINSTDQISSFGGINFVDHFLTQSNVYKSIDEHLGKRSPNAQYAYSDTIRSYLLLVLCGGDCAEDLQQNLKGELNQLGNFSPSSADTLLNMQKELATEKETFVSKSDTKHQFNINRPLNELLVKLLVSTGQLNMQEKEYVFDYDNQFIPKEKHDSKRSYKKALGYFPGIATIGNHPVYVENRNGNSNVKYKQAETLKRAYRTLKESGIRPSRSRMDCGSFTKDVIDVVQQYSDTFYIRAQRCDDLYQNIRQIEQWEQVEIGYKIYQVASIEYKPFGGQVEYRYVIAREHNRDGQGDLFTGDDFKYRAIITNDREMSDLEVIEFYNGRGESERVFDEMNNDFLWKKCHFHF